MPTHPPLAHGAVLDALVDTTTLRAPSAPARLPVHPEGVLSRAAAGPERPHGVEPRSLGAAFHDEAFDGLIAAVRSDARTDAPAYLRATEVPGGGE
jgi:hypothetical protein